MTSAELSKLLDAVALLARAAGEQVMTVYATDFAVRGKADASPVTEADERAEAVIVAGLRALTPHIAIVAEEAVGRGDVPVVGMGAADQFWLVDALDGTREFVSRNGEFTVNIALVQGGVPVLGVVLAPAVNRLYGGAAGIGAFVETGDGAPNTASRHVIRCRTVPAQGLTVLASRSHGDDAALAAFLQGKQVAQVHYAGSSLKLCLIAAGEADVYPRAGRTMAWDIAAGHAVLLAAGGAVQSLQGAPLRYGHAGFENPHFVASGLVDSPATDVQTAS
jgi:3'(2'), 5'-bisphosphate nucleotidase